MAAQNYTATVTGFKMITPTVFQLDFKTEPHFSFEGGQFISVIIPGAGPNGRDLRRAYSIASAPEQSTVEICIKIVEGGPGTTYLKGLRPGQEFKLMAIYGDFKLKSPPERNVCFIATGTGIAPFRSIAFSEKFKRQPPPKSWCLLGVRHEDELLYTDEFTAMGPGFTWIPAVSQPKGKWAGFKGRVTDVLREFGDQFPWKTTDFYLCGAGPMITEVKEILKSKDVDKTSIHQEIYYKT